MKKKVDAKKLESLGRELLLAIGEDPKREGIQDTPRRWAKWWGEFIDYDPGKVGTAFQQVRADQMVVVSGMRVWSLCEHHLLPFYCDVSVGYITAGKVLGLSKFARLAHKHAHSLQVQERLVHQLAQDIQRLAGTEDVAVLARGEHLCMTMRGVRTPGVMVSSVMQGQFRDHHEVRNEFLTAVRLADTTQR